MDLYAAEKSGACGGAVRFGKRGERDSTFSARVEGTRNFAFSNEVRKRGGT